MTRRPGRDMPFPPAPGSPPRAPRPAGPACAPARTPAPPGSWPSASLKRTPGRRAPAPRTPVLGAPRTPGRPCAPEPPAGRAPRVPAARPQPGPGPPATRGPQRRPPPAAPRVRALSPRGPLGPRAGPSGGRRGGVPLASRVPGSPLPEPWLQDETAVPDEEPAGPAPQPDPCLVRRCREWLRGVEEAARGPERDPLDTLPHLRTL